MSAVRPGLIFILCLFVAFLSACDGRRGTDSTSLIAVPAQATGTIPSSTAHPAAPTVLAAASRNAAPAAQVTAPTLPQPSAAPTLPASPSPIPATPLPATATSLAAPTRPSATPPDPAPPSVTPTATATVTPQPAATTCAHTWFFRDPPPVCPDGPAVISFAAAQRFERGQMIWIRATDKFFLLFPPGVYPNDSGQVFRDLGPLVLKPGASPENRVGETPPAGLVEPVSGFGLVWRNEVEGLDADVRPVMGWGRTAEFGYETAFQCEVQETYSWRACYLRDPNGDVIGLGWGALIGRRWELLDR